MQIDAERWRRRVAEEDDARSGLRNLSFRRSAHRASRRCVKASASPQQADQSASSNNRLFGAKTGRAKRRARLMNGNSVTTTEFRKHGAVIKSADRTRHEAK